MATYSFLDVFATISGAGGSFPLASGVGVDKEGISVTFSEDKNSMSIGADGKAMNSLRAGNSGTVTVRLQKTSPVNAMLSAMYNLQKQTSFLWGQNVIVISSIGGGDLYSCWTCAFKKFPDNMYQEDGNRIEWVFDAGTIQQQLGSGVTGAL